MTMNELHKMSDADFAEVITDKTSFREIQNASPEFMEQRLNKLGISNPHPLPEVRYGAPTMTQTKARVTRSVAPITPATDKRCCRCGQTSEMGGAMFTTAPRNLNICDDCA